MYNLVRAELFKLYKSTSFKVMVIVSIVMSLIAVGALYMLMNGLPELVETLPGSLEGSNLNLEFYVMEGIPTSLHGIDYFYMMAGGDGVGVLLGIILIPIFICSDFENLTLQDSIACGYSRWAIIVSKTIVCFIGVAILVIISAVLSGVLGTILAGFGPEVTVGVILKLIAIILTMVLAVIAHISICILFSFAFKKSGMAIGAGVVTFLVVYEIIAMISLGVDWVAKAFEYVPINFAASRITLEAAPSDFMLIIAISVAIISVVLAATWSVFKKTEIK